MNLSVFYISWYNGSAFSPSRLMKRLRDASQPVNFCTSLRHAGSTILSMALILTGLASIPRLETRKPSNLPAGTPKVHFAGFSFIRNFLKLSNVSLRSSNKVWLSLVFMTTSSTYTYTFLPICSCKHFCIHRRYVTPAFLKPNGIVT